MRAHILVVDDDANNRALIRAWLGKTCHVHEAACASEAYAALDREPIDLVLLDVMMPGESGFDACRKIKTGARHFLPVLFFTALTDQGHRNQGLAAGADDFLGKPIDRQELQLRVEAFLRIRRQETQIREQLEALARLQALKDDLVSLLVHDLRNPLTGVFGWLHVIRSTATDELREDVEGALISAARVKDAIDDLLQIRAMEEGELRPNKAKACVVDIVDQALKSVAGAARERDLSILPRGSDAVAMVDDELLRRAVENLVSNAIKHAPRGSTIDVETRTEAGLVRVNVADRGPGIPDDKKHELFAKFGALDPVIRRARRGFGLGLYLVDLVAKAHGGSVGVRDREGGGSVFDIAVPVGVP